MPRKKSPPHPGEVLREYLGEVSATQAASKSGVSRLTLSRILDGTSGVSADMAIRLGHALGTSAEIWARLQCAYELHRASKRPRLKVGRIFTAIKGMNYPCDDLDPWNSVVPVGREFGSPDYERLEELDNLAFRAFGSMLKARHWLDAPNAELGGHSPEAVAKTRQGFAKVKRLLR